MPRTKRAPQTKIAGSYLHPDADSPMRPEVGTQAQFKKQKPPQTYRYDSSLSPALEWDGQNPAREPGEAAIAELLAAAEALERGLQAASTPARLDASKPSDASTKSTVKRAGARAPQAAALRAAAEKLKRLSRPFLNWSGKAERLSFDVPTLPLFIHERLSTKAIIETLQGHKTDKQEDFFRELWGDPQHSVTDQVLRAYEYRDDWVNRMMLGDSLVGMNSLLRYESLGGQVQMIYLDPPYGVKFGSNFQPFVRKRDVAHNDDEDMTREPEMVQAYRDTWELGLHSYLTYLRDRLLLARELLHPSGSIFVQISDENLHHVREVMDEVFGAENCISVITFRKTGGEGGTFLGTTCDFLLWYSKDRSRTKYHQLFQQKNPGDEGAAEYTNVELPDGSFRAMSDDEISNPALLPSGSKVFATWPIVLPGYSEENSKPIKVEYKGETLTLRCPQNRHWSVGVTGTLKLWDKGRLLRREGQRIFKRYISDFSFTPLSNQWSDTRGEVKATYVVQTSAIIIQRCMLMTTDPGDLVLDPTCGSGTTAYVAEQWGRRWITMDTSRVPLALARQRLLTATFPYYEIHSSGSAPAPGALSRALAGQPERGETSDNSMTSARSVRTTGASSAAPEAGALPNNPAAGFVYKRKQNSKGEETGGIVPHITLKSIANNEPPAEEVLVDRPEVKGGIVRVTGPFVFEATIPTPVELERGSVEDEPQHAGKQEGSGKSERAAAGPADTAAPRSVSQDDDYGSFVDRMLEVLRKSPVLRLEGNRTVQLKQIRPPARSLSLSAEAMVDASANGQRPTLAEVVDEAEEKGGRRLPLSGKPVAIVFGPESGAVSEKLVYEAAREAHAKNYTHLYAIGFAIQPTARDLIEKCADVMGVPATYVQATPDLMMGDLLKNMRSSQIFSVCGLPEVKLSKVKEAKTSYKSKAELQYQVELLGLDVFDPISMEVDHQSGHDVPAWFLDTDYNGLCFHVTQAFFSRTGAWENLKKALKGDYDETVWDHLAGTTSAPFAAGQHGQVAVKVIDQRGNELLVVRSLKEVGK